MTSWAADCVEHALVYFTEGLDDTVQAAIDAARGWAKGEVSDEQVSDAAMDAFMSAREHTTNGYQSLATITRAASHAAASAEDVSFAALAAEQSVEAVALNSAPCEHQSNVETERYWQWETIPSSHRDELFPVAPPEPTAASCAIP
jgi:hypothetical protein